MGGERTEAADARRPPFRSTRDAKYSVNAQGAPALERRAAVDGATAPTAAIDAVFRYEGTTCTNMGRPLQFQYRVTLGPRDEGYPIREQHCAPAEGDEGHTYMCRYMSNREHLLVAIDRERRLNGQPLNDVLAWTRPASGGGLLLRARQPRAQVGPGPRDDSFRAGARSRRSR